MTTLEQVGRRIYFINLPFAAKEEAKAAIGAYWDAGRRQWYVGVSKRQKAEEFVTTLNAKANEPEDVSECRVYAKVKYRDRTYYAIAETNDLTRCRLTTLDGMTPFWVNCQECELVRRYEGREERGAYGRGTGRMIYPTIGSLARFRDEQKDMERGGIPQCAECHKRSNNLIEDLEDGMMKCPGCCDIPSQ